KHSYLDLVFTSHPRLISKCSPTDNLPSTLQHCTKHDAVSIVLKCPKPCNVNSKRQLHNIKKADIEHLDRCLPLIPWSMFCNEGDIDDSATWWTDVLMACVDEA